MLERSGRFAEAEYQWIKNLMVVEQL